MKIFHVSILFATREGLTTKDYTLQASEPDDLTSQIMFLSLYELGTEYAICAQVREIKDTVDVDCDLTLAN